MAIRNTWYVAAEPQEIAGGKLVARTILGEPVVIGRGASGRAFALFDRCPHRFAALSLGKIQGDTLRCGYHGACFDLDGKCVAVPGQEQVPDSIRVRNFPVVERHGFVWIWPGDPAQAADLGSIPDFLFRSDHPDWDGGYGHFESIAAGYRLINDNLIDVTHAEFVHPESFGCEELRLYRNPAPGSAFEAGKMTYEFFERGITFRMRSLNVKEEAPFFRWMVAQGTGRGTFPNPIDFDMQVDWAAPSFSNFVLNSRPAGVPVEEGYGVCNMHAITPETETSSHYFYRSVKDFGDAELAVRFMDGVRSIFSQDRPVLELQQRRVGSLDLFEQRPVSFAGDMLQLRARKMVKELLEAEAGGSAG
jgi:vanillate O-demethylase monooxygenase subunit